jgi:hypothetical protein
MDIKNPPKWMGDEAMGKKIAPFLNLLVKEKEAHNELMKLVNDILENEIAGKGMNAEELYDKLTDWRIARNEATGKALEPIYDILFVLSVPLARNSYDRNEYVQNQTRRRRQEGKIKSYGEGPYPSRPGKL